MFNKPKGTRDFKPTEMKKRRIIENKLREVFERYNFKEICTPTFESFELLSKKTGEEIRKQLFVFKDHGNREMGLRPEMTSSVVRFYINELKNLPKPIKLYYFSNCFRYENPQAGRYREFWQMGCELIGSAYPISDAEIINLAMDGLENINMDYEIHIGHLGILKGIFSFFNVNEDEELKIRRLIDKEDYNGLKEYLSTLNNKKDGNVMEDIIFQLLDFKGDRDIINEVEYLLKDFPKSLDSLNNLRDILDFVKYENITINFGIARGLDYYTGMVFEIYGTKEGARQVCGGGRYDNLIELFGGQKVPAVGFAYGFDRIMLNIDDFEVEEDSILVVPVQRDKELIKECIKIGDKLRRVDKIVELELMNRRLNKALDYANTVGIKKVIIVGKRELENNTVILKNMETGEQKVVSIDDLERTV